MLKIFLIILGGILAIIIDGVVMPSLFHIRELFLVSLFLIALILTQGFRPAVLACGITIAWLTELWTGLFVGSLVLPWLVAFGAWEILTHFFSLRPLSEVRDLLNGSLLAVIGFGLFLLMMFSSLLMIKIWYGQWDLVAFNLAIKNPFLIFYEIIGLSVCMYFLSLISNWHGQRIPN